MLCPTINLLTPMMLQEDYFPACCCSSCCICCSAWLESSAKRMPTRAECFMNFSQHFCTHCMHKQQSGCCSQQGRKILEHIRSTQCFHDILRHKSGLQDDQNGLKETWGTTRDICTVTQQASRSLAFSSVPSRSLLLKLSTQSVKHFCTRELYIRRLHAQKSP